MMFASGKSYHATRWANALADRGLEVAFVTVHKIVRPLDGRISACDLSSAGKIDYLTSMPRVRRLLKSFAPDIVHSHSAGGYAFMGLISGFHPWVLSIYGSDVFVVPHRSLLHKAMVGYMLSRADKVLSTSEAMATEVQRLYSNQHRPSVTPFGVDVNLFRRQEKRTGTEPVTKIGIVKKLEHVYGIDVLIEAFELLSQRCNEELELHIVGDGTKRSELEAQRLNSDCADRIVFHGAIGNADVPRYLEELDIFVVPSRSESFGVAAVEAMALSLPLVVTDVGGLPEVVEHEVTGLVVPAENPEALAGALHRLVCNPAERVAFGVAGREKVETEYDWNNNVSEMIRIYDSLLGRTGR